MSKPQAPAKGNQAPAPVAEAKATPVAVQAPDFGGHAGAGFEGTGKDDLAIPFISILQGLSPEVKRSEGAYIDGAAEGMLLNTVTKDVIDTAKARFVLIPCAYTRALIEWRVREKGGGFVAEHPVSFPDANKTTRDDRSRDILPNGNQLNDTRSFYVLVLDEANGTTSPAVVTMTSTQIKKAKQWLMQQNLLRLSGPNGAYTPPMFASKWLVETVAESNEKGSWMAWKFTHAGYLSGPADPVFVQALQFHKSVTAGAAKADMTKSAEGPATEGSGARQQRVNPDTGEMEDDKDIPF